MTENDMTRMFVKNFYESHIKISLPAFDYKPFLWSNPVSQPDSYPRSTSMITRPSTGYTSCMLPQSSVLILNSV